MIRWMLLALLGINLLAWSQDASAPQDAVWSLTTANHKKVKVNGVALKTAQFWEFPSWSQIETQDEEAMVFLAGKYYLKVYKNTHLRWDNSVLYLNSGRVYIKSISPEITLVIPSFFKFKITSADFVADYDKETKKSEFQVLTQNQKIQIDSDDREIPVSEGTQISFQPEYVDGEIAYDFLLNDRKIPKFHMEKSKIEKPILMDANLWKVPLKKALVNKQKVAKKTKVDNSKNICKKPNGILNACHFVKEEKYCIRYACNLNGQWAQRTIFEANEFCPKEKTVKNCEWLGH